MLVKHCLYLLFILIACISTISCIGLSSKPSLLSLNNLIASTKSNKSSKKSSLKSSTKSKKLNINDLHDDSKKISVIEPLDDEKKIESHIEGEIQSTSSIDQSKPQTIDMIVSLISTLGNLLLMKYINAIDNKSESFIVWSRIVFASYLVIVQGIFFLVKYIITKADDQTTIDVKSPLSSLPMNFAGMNNHPLMGMLGNVATKVFKSTSMTVREYDIQQLNYNYRTLLLEIIIATIMHLRNPKGKFMLYIAAHGLMWKIRNPIIDIHLLRFPATGKHQRPFTSGLSSLSKLMSGPGMEESAMEETSTLSEPNDVNVDNDATVKHDSATIKLTASSTSNGDIKAPPVVAKKKTTKFLKRSLKAKGKKTTNPVSTSDEDIIDMDALSAVDDMPELAIQPLASNVDVVASRSEDGDSDSQLVSKIDELVEKTISSLKKSEGRK